MITLYQVDSFTNVPFKGNPAGVCITDKLMDDAIMKNIAAEMNLAETAFVVLNGQEYIIRYFTPSHEVNLCGHATLASAHIMYEKGIVKKEAKITFRAKGGILIISKVGDEIAMDFPQYKLEAIEIPTNIYEALGVRAIEAYKADYNWTVIVCNSEDEIINARPNYSLMQGTILGHCMITSKATTYGFDFVLRCFAPDYGINEDPVTGSAHCALGPLWGRKLNKTSMNSLQVSRRTGTLNTTLTGDRVLIKGEAITIFEINMNF